MNSWSSGHLQGSEDTLYDTVMVHTRRYTGSHAHRTGHAQREPAVNYILRGITVSHCSAINCDVGATLAGDADRRGASAWGQRVHGNLYAFSQFGFEPKTALKNNKVSKKQQ